MKNDYIYKVFIFSLAFLLLILPLSEALKQIAYVFSLLSGVILVIKYNLNIKRDTIFYSFLVLVIFSIFSAIFTPYHNYMIHSLKDSVDIIRVFILFILIRAISIDDEILKKYLIPSLFIGYIVAILWGLSDEYIFGKRFMELHSVGHRNHSAIYMLITFIISMAIFYSQNISKFLKNLALFIMFISVIGIFATGSRAVIYVLPIIYISYIIFFKNISIKSIIIFILFFIIVGFIFIVFFQDSILILKLKEGLNPSGRVFLAKLAIERWLDGAVFTGIGSGNYALIDYSKYFNHLPLSNLPPHAHNTYLNYLVERGLFAFIAYITFQISLLILFFKCKKNLYISIALLILFINIIISFVNTTFHHENALLMIIFWAIALYRCDNLECNKESESL